MAYILSINPKSLKKGILDFRALIITIHQSSFDNLPKGLQSTSCYMIPEMIYDIFAYHGNYVIELN